MRILYLTDERLDFISDQVLCGLRQFLGPDVIDFPKKRILYTSEHINVDPSLIWCNGNYAFFMEDIAVDREDIERKICKKYFDAVINSSCWRIKSPVHEGMVVLDGEDHGLLNPKYYGKVKAYFKRELLSAAPGVLPIQFSMPDHLVNWSQVPKVKKFHASFSVYQGIRSEIAQRYSPISLNSWNEYISDIRKSWFGISPLGAGYDCQRHYEILGQAVLCVYLDRSAPKILQESFIDNQNCIVWRTANELFEKIDKCKDKEAILQRGKESLVQYHLSSVRAKQVLQEALKYNSKKSITIYDKLSEAYYPNVKRRLSNKATAFAVEGVRNVIRELKRK